MGMPKLNTPESRSEFEHNINLLVEDGHNITKATEGALQSFLIFTYPKLKHVKFLPNGRIDLNTVDESLRLNANTKNHMESMGPFREEPED